ncbi:uncharacterized protein CEXT_629281 [Caerostris extrusa]|uniref:Uncharacterized protein n=1 Tax=Caerostris extrusa TaxID=172846 RepID=A0AAV4NXU7_CAEEX|nr:uncharacterized protein CEXT_629281 [Caerostris extrusa]
MPSTSSPLPLRLDTRKTLKPHLCPPVRLMQTSVIRLFIPHWITAAIDRKTDFSYAHRFGRQRGRKRRGGHRRDERPLRERPLVSSDVEAGSEEDEYFKPIKKLCMAPSRPSAPPVPVAAPSSKPLSSFFIKDILSHKPASIQRTLSTDVRGIVRPWDLDSSTGSRRRPARRTMIRGRRDPRAIRPRALLWLTLTRRRWTRSLK